MPQYRVVSAVMDKNNLVLYTEDGKEITVPQRDPRVAGLLEKIMPFAARGEVAVVDLDTYDVYAAFEKKTNGLIRFLRVAKEKVKNLFTAAEPEQVEETLRPVQEAADHLVEEAAKALDTLGAKPITAEDILSEAKAIDPHGEIKPSETVIAVVSDGPVQTIIPGAENLREQIQHAVSTKRSVGVENLIKRMASMMDKRSHSVEDLLRFLEKGDLPVADDGSIIAYKRLNKSDKEGTFVDCHSGRVTQKVGSYVVVDESMVDKNRRNECSNGLHIARRAYLGSFHGNVMVLCKIAPEDVITVPHNDPNKVRVCGYHILDVIPEDAARKLIANRPMTDNPVASEILARALHGKHIGKLEEVRITEQKGGGLIITPLNPDGTKAAKAVVTEEEKTKAKAFDDKESPASTAPVDIKKLNQQISQEEAKAAEEKSLSNKDKAGIYYNNMVDETLPISKRKYYALELKQLKGKAKISYEKLGLPEHTAGRIEAILSSEFEENFKKIQQQEAKAAAEAEKAVEQALAPESVLTNKDKAKLLHAVLADERNTVTKRQEAAQSLMDLKKRAKQSWEKLGFHFDILQLITLVQSLKEGPKTNAEKAREAFEAKDFLTIANIKSKAKVSYEKLGFNSVEVIRINEALNRVEIAQVKEIKSEPQTKAEPAKQAVKPKDGAKETAINKTADKGLKTAEQIMNPFGSKKEQARDLYNNQNWKALADLKKSAKVSWERLGFNSSEEENIRDHIER